MQEEVGALDADDSELAPQLLESRVSSIVAGGRVDRISSVGGYYDLIHWRENVASLRG